MCRQRTWVEIGTLKLRDVIFRKAVNFPVMFLSYDLVKIRF